VTRLGLVGDSMETLRHTTLPWRLLFRCSPPFWSGSCGQSMPVRRAAGGIESVELGGEGSP
jgi:hypothetical protein